MDFKSRFEGHKAFINKHGNIADAQNKQIIVLKKPAQSRESETSLASGNQLDNPEISFGARCGSNGQQDSQIANAINEWRKEQTNTKCLENQAGIVQQQLSFSGQNSPRNIFESPKKSAKLTVGISMSEH